MARIVELIITDVYRGRGTAEDLGRTVYQLWTKDGLFLGEFDSGPNVAQTETRSYINGEVIRSLQ